MLKKTISSCLFIIICLFSLQCSVHYKKARSCCRNWAPGYSHKQYTDTVFQVTFTGNTFTKKEQVYDLVLLRSAELTIAHDYDYFVVLEKEEGKKRNEILLVIECFVEKPQAEDVFDSLEVYDTLTSKYNL